MVINEIKSQIQDDLYQITRKWNRYWKRTYFPKLNITKNDCLDLLAGFGDNRFINTSIEFNHYLFYTERIYELYEILLKLFNPSEYFSEEEYKNWFMKNIEKFQKYLYLSAQNFDPRTGNSFNFFEYLNSVFKIRLLDNFAFGFDYFEKLSLTLANRCLNKNYRKIQEVYMINNISPNPDLITTKLQLNFLKNVKVNKQDNPITNLHDLIHLLVNLRHARAHKLFEFYPRETILTFLTNKSKSSEHKVILNYSGLIILAEFARVIVKIFQESIYDKLNHFEPGIDIDKSVQMQKLLNTIKDICNKIEYKNQILKIKSIELIQDQLNQGTPYSDLKIYQSLSTVCKNLGIKKSAKEIEDLDNFPAWWYYS